MFSSISRREGDGQRAYLESAEMPLIDGIRILVLVLVLVTVPLAKPHRGVGANGVTVAVALGCYAVAWVAWMLTRHRFLMMVTALAVMGASAGVLAGPKQRSSCRSRSSE